MAQKIRLVVDKELSADYPQRQGAEVIVTLSDRREVRCRLPDVVPADAAEVEQRFSAAAAERLGRTKAERLFELVMSLEDAPEATPLARLTHCADLSRAV